MEMRTKAHVVVREVTAGVYPNGIPIDDDNE